MATVRAGNVIGGGDWALDRLIPDILRAFQAGQDVEVRSPNAIRPWQHVLEPLSGYLELAERLFVDGVEYAEGWNFGPDEEDALSVGWIVSRMGGLWGKGAGYEVDEGSSPHEANYLKLDCSKSKMKLYWQPKWRLDEALRRIVKWHKAWVDGEDMQEYTLTEISDHENMNRHVAGGSARAGE